MTSWARFAEPDPLQSIKHKIELLDRECPRWWRVRGGDMATAVQIPATESENEWSEALLAFDQLLVEGICGQGIAVGGAGIRQGSRKGVGGRSSSWRSVWWVTEWTKREAKEVVKPLREAHQHRSIVKGHSSQGRKRDVSKKARKSYGSFRAHFEDLVGQCDRALSGVMEAMGVGLE